jgi:hypothetical protein
LQNNGYLLISPVQFTASYNLTVQLLSGFKASEYCRLHHSSAEILGPADSITQSIRLAPIGDASFCSRHARRFKQRRGFDANSIFTTV